MPQFSHCNMLWIGAALGLVERACMRSVMRQGHEIRLYCYGAPPAGVPEGVRIMDAEEVISSSRIIRHESGSTALFANLFRYELQRQGLGLWLDADVYLLRPIPLADYVLTEEEPGRINNSVFSVPADSPLLSPLLRLFEQRTVPPWLPLRERLRAWLRLVRTGKTGLSRMPWGVAGPTAVSYLARELGLSYLATPSETFHPVDWRKAAWILDPEQSLADKVGPATLGIHLWNERIRHFKDQPAPPGSFLARLHEEGE